MQGQYAHFSLSLPLTAFALTAPDFPLYLYYFQLKDSSTKNENSVIIYVVLNPILCLLEQKCE